VLSQGTVEGRRLERNPGRRADSLALQRCVHQGAVRGYRVRAEADGIRRLAQRPWAVRRGRKVRASTTRWAGASLTRANERDRTQMATSAQPKDPTSSEKVRIAERQIALVRLLV